MTVDNMIYTQDCLTGLSQLDSCSVDTIITSPPYNKKGLLGKKGTGNQIWKKHEIDYDTYGDDDNMSYSTTSKLVQSEVAYVKVTSPGFGYESLPNIHGLYKKSGDSAELSVDLIGTTIGSIDVVSGGRRYVNPAIFIVDTTGNGEGATATATVENGIITSVTVTDSGTNYTEPVVRAVEQDGKFISLTKDIGQIKAVKVLSSGTKITSDSTMSPELEVESSFVVTEPDNSSGVFQRGQHVYQGTLSLVQASGTVVSYDGDRQLLTIEDIVGEFKQGENIYNSFGTIGEVLVEGQPFLSLETGSVSDSIGKFVNDSSMVSSEYSVIQDSEYYQRFSSEIQSPLQLVQYETFVKDIIHPTGFALFSSVIINSSVQSGCISEGATLTIEDGGPDTAPVAVIGLDGVDYTNDIAGLSGYTSITGLSPDE